MTTSSPAGRHAWHALGLPEVLVQLGADAASGLAPDEARRRLSRVGPNRVADHPETPLWRLLLDQFRSVVVLLLLAAAAIAWVLGERAESLAIMAALGLNAAIGFASEWRARRSLARLRALVVPHTIVRRGGHIVRLPSADSSLNPENLARGANQRVLSWGAAPVRNFGSRRGASGAIACARLRGNHAIRPVR
jgi:Ca2+-transporting ATPase